MLVRRILGVAVASKPSIFFKRHQTSSRFLTGVGDLKNKKGKETQRLVPIESCIYVKTVNSENQEVIGGTGSYCEPVLFSSADGLSPDGLFGAVD